MKPAVHGFSSSDLDIVPRVGWTQNASPITQLPKLADHFGSSWLGCKRDDLCDGLYGGSKVRKLDFLLADPAFKQAGAWAGIGAIGSGHLVACCSAAEALGKRIENHVFWEPVSQGITENLSYTASVSEKLHYYPSRTMMLLRRPELAFRSTIDRCALIPVGATCPLGILGMVRAGLELSEQVREGELPEPDRIYVALGSGGTTVGLAIGLALGGLSSVIHAVATVEWLISTRFRLSRLISATKSYLSANGLKEMASTPPSKIVIDRTRLGKGYGHPTADSRAAVKRMAEHGLTIEPVYTGKAVAAMLHDLQSFSEGPVLFWNTMRRNLPDSPDGWRSRLPEKLKLRLADEV